MYVEQIKLLAAELGIPVLTGTTAQRKRDAIYEDFKAGRIGVLAVSKIASGLFSGHQSPAGGNDRRVIRR